MEENHEVVKLWDGKSPSTTRPLRRPNSNAMPNPNETEPFNSSSGENVQNSEPDMSILSKSKLSVDAKEWFPANYSKTPAYPVSSVQKRLQSIRSNADEVQESSQSQGDQNNTVRQNDCDPTIDTMKLKEIVFQLIYDPGQFDRVLGTFLEILQPYSEEVDVCNIVADMLFDSALVQPNFRYNAARLCTFVQENCPLVRSRLHILCEKELAANRERQGLTLFLAELYTQLHFENLYGKSLLSALRNLLSSGEPDDIKCLCHALKLCGHSLDLYDRSSMDDIFSQMQSVRRGLPPNVLSLLEAVIALRGRQWDHGSPVPSSSGHSQNGFTNYNVNDCDVLLTAEESDFYYENCNEYFMGDPDELCDPEPEMDEEIQAAFKEFVRLSKR